MIKKLDVGSILTKVKADIRKLEYQTKRCVGTMLEKSSIKLKITT